MGETPEQQALETRFAAARLRERELNLIELERSNERRRRVLELADRPFRRFLHENGALLLQVGAGMAVGSGVAIAVTLLLAQR